MSLSLLFHLADISLLARISWWRKQCVGLSSLIWVTVLGYLLITAAVSSIATAVQKLNSKLHLQQRKRFFLISLSSTIARIPKEVPHEHYLCICQDVVKIFCQFYLFFELILARFLKNMSSHVIFDLFTQYFQAKIFDVIYH